MRSKSPLRSMAASAVLSLIFSAFAIAVEPADPKANQDVRRIINWLYTLPNRTTNRVISGQY